jgi:hypothetical protein
MNSEVQVRCEARTDREQHQSSVPDDRQEPRRALASAAVSGGAGQGEKPAKKGEDPMKESTLSKITLSFRQ